MLRVGIDQASQHHDVCLAPEGQAPSYLRVPNDADGLEELLTAIRRLEPNPAQVHVAIEGSGQGLFVAALLAAGFRVYPVNPKAVDRYRDRLSPAGSKDDRRDALVLAEILRTDRHRLQPLRLESDILRQLRVAYSHHQTLVEERTRLLNQLTACLRAYYPRALELFADLGRPVAWTFLRAFPTPAHFARARRSRIEKLLRQHRYPGVAAKTAELLELARKPQLPADPATVALWARRMLFLVDQLEAVCRELEACHEQLETLVQAHPDGDLFRSMKGIGTVLAAGMITVFGEDRQAVPSVRPIQCRSGTAPVTVRSGKTIRVRFRHACNKQARNTLQLLAQQLVLHHAWAREIYQTHRDRGRHHHEALRIVAHHALRVLFAMWRNRQPYDPTRFEAARRQRQQPKAA